MMDESQSNRLLKNGVLILLCVQNAGHALLTRYSQGILKESYSNTEVVFVAEIIKLFVSGYLSITDKDETDAVGNGFGKLFWLAWNCRKIIVLVLLYSIANILSYEALARVDASVYTVLLQILTTAAFAVCILQRNLSSVKWRALLLLVLGCILVASPAFNRPCEEVIDPELNIVSTDKKPSALESLKESALGVFFIIVMVVISGYSAIYFEQMLKKAGDKLTVWERNFQLALFSALLLTGFMFGYEKNDGSFDNFTMFRNWTPCAVLIAVIQAGGGLLVAATLKYADAVLKTLATSGSIVLSAVLGFVLLGGTLDIFVSIGCISTILAITDYTLDPTPILAAPSNPYTPVRQSDPESRP